MEDEKPQWKPKFKSEFSMGELDFHRYDDWLKKTDLSSARVNSCQVPTLEQVQNYFAELNVLYKNWVALISSQKIKDDIYNKVNEAKMQKRKWELSIESGIDFNKVTILNLVDVLDEIHTKLLEIKQLVGLGIVIKRVMTTKEKIKHGIRPRIDLSGLPEA